MSVPTIQVLPTAQTGVVAASSPTTTVDGLAFARALERATTERAAPRALPGSGTDSGRAASGPAGQNATSKPATDTDTDATSGVRAEAGDGSAGTAGNAGTGGETTGVGGNGAEVATVGLPGLEAPPLDGAAELPESVAAEDTSDLAGDESGIGTIGDRTSAATSADSADEAAAGTHRAGDSVNATDLAARTGTPVTPDAGNASAVTSTAAISQTAIGNAANGTGANGTAQGSVPGAHSLIAGGVPETGAAAAAGTGTGPNDVPEQNNQPAPTTTATSTTTAAAMTGPVVDVVPQQVTQAAPATVFTDAISGPTATQATEAAAGTRGAPQPQALAEQMRAPLLNLRDAGVGEHTLTLRVEPERLGPVQVRAHIGADGIRIELVGATDVGRDGLKAILTDLRRDLAAAGMNARLDVNSDPDSTFGERNQTGDPDGRDRTEQTAVATPEPTAVPGHRAHLTESARTSDAGLRGGVDILA